MRDDAAPLRIARLAFVTPLVAFVFAGAWDISPSIAFGFIAVWGTLASLIRLVDLMTQLYWPRGLRVCLMLPLADRDLFRMQWRSAWLDSAFLFIDFATVYLICAFKVAHANKTTPDSLDVLAAIWFAAIQSLLSFATAALLLARLHPRPFFVRLRDGLGSGLAFLVASICVLFDQNKGVDMLVPLLKWLAGILYWVTPAGWVNAAYHLGTTRGHLILMLPLIPVGLLIGSFPASRRRLLETFCSHAPFLAEHMTQSIAAPPGRETAVSAWRPGIASTSGPTTVVDGIKDGELASLPDWSNAGILEKWVVRWLTPRELIVLSIGHRFAPQWSKRWITAAKALAFGTGAALLAGGVSADLFYWVFYVTCLVVAMLVLLFLDFEWPGFRYHKIITARVPIYALLPIGNREISALMTKISCVRFAAAIPIVAAAGAIAGWKHGVGVGAGMLYALEVAMLFLATSPFLLTVGMANRLRHVREFRCLLLFLAVVLIGLTLLILSIIGMATFDKVRIVALISAAAFSWLVHAIFTYAYNRGWFDPDTSP